MKKTLLILIPIAVILVVGLLLYWFSSPIIEDGYSKKNGIVHFAGNRIEIEMDYADYDTFEILGGIANDMTNQDCMWDNYTGLYAKDKNNIYYNSRTLKNADLNSFEYIERYYAKDRNAVYFAGIKLEDAELNSLEFINCDYLKDKQYVFYGNQKIEGADPDTFVILNDFFRKDKNSVYYENRSPNYEVIKLANADPDSFSIINPYYSKDKKRVYYKHTDPDSLLITVHTIEVADADTFKIVDDNEVFAKDNKYAYLHGQVLKGLDGPSFDIVGGFYKDKNSVYYGNSKLSGADPKTFTAFPGQFYGKDANSAYQMASPIFGIDLETFQPLECLGSCWLTKDKNNIYYTNKIIENADLDTFHYVSAGYSKDKYNFYWQGKVIENADIETFKIFDYYNIYAKDKNKFYKDGKEMTQEELKDLQDEVSGLMEYSQNKYKEFFKFD